MDPNKTLRVIRDQLKAFYAETSDVPEFDDVVLADAVEALDEWLSMGGFLPKAWQR